MSARPWVPLAALLVVAFPASAAETQAAAPSDPRNFTWIVPGVLAIGGGGLNKEQVDWLHGEGFRAIADLRAEHQDPEDHIRAKGMAFLDLPIDHAVDINVTQLKQFVAWVKEQQAAGRPAYVHCTNGWHRAAAFAVAWEMERADGELTFDEAAKNATARRPGTVMRAPAALLAYEAHLRDEPGLTVLLRSPISRPAPNGTMPVEVEELTAQGTPAEGAKVFVWTEESRLRIHGTTGPDGRFAFTYHAPAASRFMDHLYARGSFAGHVDGADNVELFFQQPVRSGSLDVDATWTPAGIAVEVRKDGRHAYSHVVATAEGGWSARELASRGRVLLPLPDPARPVTVRAEHWGAEGAQVVVQPPAPPVVEPEPKPEPVPPGIDKVEETPPEPKAEPFPPGPAVPPPQEAEPAPGPEATPPPEASAPRRMPWTWAIVGGSLVGLAGLVALHQRRRAARAR